MSPVPHGVGHGGGGEGGAEGAGGVVAVAVVLGVAGAHRLVTRAVRLVWANIVLHYKTCRTF